MNLAVSLLRNSIFAASGRIFPALAVVLAAVLVAGTFVLLNDEYQQLGKHIAAGSGFVANLALWQESGYFDNSGATKPLLHLWSLGVEEQFYLVWPLALLIAWWCGWNLFWVACAVAVISFGLNIAAVQNHPVATFYLPATRFWELMFGALLAVPTPRQKLGPIWPARNVVALAGAGLIGFGLVTVSERDLYPGWWALLPTLGTTLLIAAGERAAINRWILSNRLLVGIGLISYPLYLWHWPLFSFARIIEGGAPPPALNAILILASIALAWMTYRYIEMPIRHDARTGRMAAALCGLLLIIGGAGYAAFRLSSLSLRPLSEASAQFVGPGWKYAKNDICLRRYPFKEADSYGWWFCMQNRDAAPTVFLLGDSYANALYPGFAHNDALKAQTILSIGDCGLGVPGHRNTPEDADEINTTLEVNNPCYGQHGIEQQQFIQDVIADNRSLKYVIMQNSGGTSDFVDLAGLLKIIDFIEQHGSTIILFTPQLAPPYDIKSCVPRLFGYTAHKCEIDPSERIKLDRSLKPVIDWLKINRPEVLVFDQNELFCDGATKCSMMRNGIPLLRDEYGHLSEYGSVLLGELFVQWAKANAPGILRADRPVELPAR